MKATEGVKVMKVYATQLCVCVSLEGVWKFIHSVMPAKYVSLWTEHMTGRVERCLQKEF